MEWKRVESRLEMMKEEESRMAMVLSKEMIDGEDIEGIQIEVMDMIGDPTIDWVIEEVMLEDEGMTGKMINAVGIMKEDLIEKGILIEFER